VELYSPNVDGRLVPRSGSLRGLLFYDIARAANRPLAGEAAQRVSIASMGAGLRWNVGRDFNLRFDLARVMGEGASKKVGDLHGHASVYVGF
jgi:hemolysin activation/secretion protein